MYASNTIAVESERLLQLDLSLFVLIDCKMLTIKVKHLEAQYTIFNNNILRVTKKQKWKYLFALFDRKGSINNDVFPLVLLLNVSITTVIEQTYKGQSKNSSWFHLSSIILVQLKNKSKVFHKKPILGTIYYLYVHVN